MESSSAASAKRVLFGEESDARPAFVERRVHSQAFVLVFREPSERQRRLFARTLAREKQSVRLHVDADDAAGRDDKAAGAERLAVRTDELAVERPDGPAATNHSVGVQETNADADGTHLVVDQADPEAGQRADRRAPHLHLALQYRRMHHQAGTGLHELHVVAAIGSREEEILLVCCLRRTKRVTCDNCLK